MRSFYINLLLYFGLIILICSCGQKEIVSYTGPKVTHVEVFKAKRIMFVYHKDKLLKKYPIDLGFGSAGAKRFEGDGKTPEGRYFINWHNPKSRFTLSLGISYPNDRDKAYAKSIGRSPGGDIFIHGQPNSGRTRKSDWTAGCIALKNNHIRELYEMVENNTEISIFP